MNNREYANKLPDEEFVKWGRKFFGTDWDLASVVMSDKEIENASLIILSKPHETTADEDFAKMDFHNIKESDDMTYFAYEDLEGRQLYISKYGNEYDSRGEMWNDDLVNNIRTIADKKRKEVWG